MASCVTVITATQVVCLVIETLPLHHNLSTYLALKLGNSCSVITGIREFSVLLWCHLCVFTKPPSISWLHFRKPLVFFQYITLNGMHIFKTLKAVRILNVSFTVSSVLICQWYIMYHIKHMWRSKLLMFTHNRSNWYRSNVHKQLSRIS